MLASRPLLAIALCLLSAPLFAQGKTGSISGKVLLLDPVPEPVFLVMKGDQAVKDAKVCAAQNVFSEKLVVEPESKGIANVFVFMRKAPTGYKLPKEAAVPKLTLDQKGCQFLPHAMIVQTNQQVHVISNDDCIHNFRTNPLRGMAVNELMGPNDKVGATIKFDGAEPLPMKVGCDIHQFMEGWWLVIDHPFAALTDAKGEFKLENVPAGEHEFRIWQEQAGYVEKSIMIKVKAGENTELKTIEVPLAKFN